jgi:hypothetical protein
VADQKSLVSSDLFDWGGRMGRPLNQDGDNCGETPHFSDWGGDENHEKLVIYAAWASRRSR